VNALPPGSAYNLPSKIDTRAQEKQALIVTTQSRNNHNMKVYRADADLLISLQVILFNHQYPRCSSCYSILAGQSLDDEFDQYHFFKHAVNIVSQSTRVSPRYPAVVHLSARLLARGKSHASFRFIVDSGEQGQRTLLLWVFQPDIKVSVSPPDQWQDDDPRYLEEWLRVDLIRRIRSPIRAMKVIYLDLSSSSTRHEWQDDTSIDRITYPKDHVDRLATYLDATNLWQPESQRELNEMKVGWLERL